MVSPFFLGGLGTGLARGAKDFSDLSLKNRELKQQEELKTRELDIKQQDVDLKEKTDLLTRSDKEFEGLVKRLEGLSKLPPEQKEKPEIAQRLEELKNLGVKNRLNTAIIRGVKDPERMKQIANDTEARLSAALLSPDPVAVGKQAGKAERAGAEAIVGEPLTPAEARIKAGVAPKTPLVSITQKGDSAEEVESAKSRARRTEDISKKVNEAAQAAVTRKANIQRIKNAIESGQFVPGSFGEFRQFLSQSAELFGFADAAKALGNAATAEELVSASNTLATDLADRMSRVTNLSLKLIKDAVPSLLRTPGGNLLIADAMERIADWEIRRAELANQMEQEFGTLFPKGKRSFNQRILDLQEENPIIGPDLVEQFETAAKQKGSLREAAENFFIPENAPAGTKLHTRNGVPLVTKDGKRLFEIPQEGGGVKVMAFE